MEALRATIRTKRVRNIESRYFVPQKALYDLMTQEKVAHVVSEAEFEREHFEELTQEIMKGCRKIFAILVLIRHPQSLLAFVEDDQLQSSSPDQKLPLALSRLRALLPTDDAAEEFYQQQWEFAAPVFTGGSLPRVLHQDLILPFIEQKEVGEGGFGIVSEVTIEHSHQTSGAASSPVIVRKEFKPGSTSKADYDLELRNLSILRLIKHPHIIEMLGCYTYRGKHNLVFPMARGGSLANILEGNGFLPFLSFTDLVIALCGLSSALNAVHTFSSDDLKLIGCHHDLKPSNILVDDEKLLLADFGLTRLKGHSQESQTPFKGAIGDYLAPECEDLERDFEEGTVRRSSDIWSLGCILSEILTYTLKGSHGVSQFRATRLFNIENWKFSRFHCGPNSPNQKVLDWLADVKINSSGSERSMAELIEQMLHMKPEDRPNIRQVTARLRLIALQGLCALVYDLYSLLGKRSSSVLALLELRRFESWQWALENAESGSSDDQFRFLGDMSDSVFGIIVSRLGDLEELLKSITNECDKPRSRLFLPLRNTNDYLLSILSDVHRTSATTLFECRMLQTENLELLANINQTLVQDSGMLEHRISLLAAVKRLNVLVSKRYRFGRKTPNINPKDFENCEPVGDFFKCAMLDTTTQRTSKVLVEWKAYEEHYSDERIANELFGRIEAIVGVLKSIYQQCALPVLHCRGFYHDCSRYALGLVYDFPQPEASRKLGSAGNKGGEQIGRGEVEIMSPITLRKVFDDDPRGKRRPSLGERFRLAHSLATSILEFHKIGWLQKSISSFNIVFFYSQPNSSSSFVIQPLERPYFVGFLHSRQNDETAFTEGPSEDGLHRDYQHPVYLRGAGRVRFRAEFDYYSLGLVLLEIGLWSSLGNIAASKEEFKLASPEELRVKLLELIVPLLGQRVGSIYQDAVAACLKGDKFVEALERSQDLQPEEGVPGLTDFMPSSGTCLKFKQLVVDRLALCKA